MRYYLILVREEWNVPVAIVTFGPAGQDSLLSVASSQRSGLQASTFTARRDLSKKRLNDFNEHYKNISETVYFCHSLFFFLLDWKRISIENRNTQQKRGLQNPYRLSAPCHAPREIIAIAHSAFQYPRDALLSQNWRNASARVHGGCSSSRI